MAIIIAGHNLGLDDTSLRILNRQDSMGAGSLNQNTGQQVYVNASNGNLVVQEQDSLLTSRGQDFNLVRTYNSRGRLNSSINGMSDWGWTWQTDIQLSINLDTIGTTKVTGYEVAYGDGTAKYFDYDSTRKLWISTDGAGAYETLNKLADNTYVLTRADQSVVKFDVGLRLSSITDTNGVTMSFQYANVTAKKLTSIIDDTGYVITLNYKSLLINSVATDFLDTMTGTGGVVLVRYGWTNGLLTSVTDRYGHVTTYTYDSNKMLTGIALPASQTVNGQVQNFDARKLQFVYQTVSWKDTPHFKSAMDNGPMYILSDVIDPTGAKTSFEYGFTFAATKHPSDRDVRYTYSATSFLTGGLTRVIDALGNARATSNDAEFVAWRQANGYYATYNATTVKASTTLTAQYNAIRYAQSVSYAYDADGYLTSITDEQGFKTSYTYDTRDNLTSVVDRNGYGVTTSDSAYYRSLRKDLGYVDVSGNGKLAASLTATEKTALLALYTTSYTWDANGNMLSMTDHGGNLTTYTWTSFNKMASMTSAMGNALATLDTAAIQQKRVELGYPSLLSSLTAVQKTALKALYTTNYTYDAKQNLIQQVAPNGDITRYEYDAYGNQTRRIVYTDKNDLATASKQQVTVYGYDAYGNNTSITDAEGKTSTYQYDPFGNLLRAVDGRAGVSTYTYDASNRRLTSQDPEGNVTAYAWDAVGNMIAVTDANGHTVTRVYDAGNRLITILDPSASSTANNRSTQFRYDVLGNRVQTTDAEGRVTSYGYDQRRQLVQITTPQVIKVNADGSETSVSYNSTIAYDGETNVVTTTDNNGNVTQTLYNNLNLVKRVTDATGNITETSYDANLNAVQIVVGVQLAAAQRRTLRFGFDQKERRVRAVDALGGSEITAYDGADNAVAVTDENGNTTNYEYDRNNRLLKEIRPQVIDPRSGSATRYTVLHQYDANGNEIATTDENGNITTISYDRDDRRVLVTDNNGIKTAFSWDSRDNLTQVAIGVTASLDANGKVVISNADDAQVTTYVYDEFRQLLSVTDGVGNALFSSNAQLYQDMRTALSLPALASNLGAAQKTQVLQAYTTRYGYDRVGNRVQETDHLGRITKTGFDALDRQVSMTEAFGLPEQRISSMRYDGNGNLVKSTDANGRVTRMRYDGMDRVTGMTDALGNVTSTQYDNVGNQIGMSEGVGTAAVRSSIWVYDLNNRLISETSGAGRTMRYEYDAVGNRLKVIDGRGNATRYVYDALNRNVRIIDPTSFETRYEYDGVGNQLTMTDARGGISRFTYDPGNRRIQVTDAEGRRTRFDYDVLEHIVTQTTDPGGSSEQVTRYRYDAEGHLRSMVDARGVTSSSDYDAQYNLLASTDANGNTTRYGYDALNRQILVTDALGRMTRFAYDAMQNRLTETDSLNRVRSFTYDGLDRTITATDARGVQTLYAYDAVGNQVSITQAANLPGQARAKTFQYDADGLLLRAIDAQGKATVYAYDAARNVSQVTDARNNVTRYQYDANNRVSQLTDAQGNVTVYQYDGNGNRARIVDGNGNAWVTYYNANNEADLNIDPSGYATQRKFNRNGNLVEETRFMTRLASPADPAQRPALPQNSQIDQVTRYTYDSLNRLASRTDPLGRVSSFSYDAAGNLQTETDENGNVTRHVYDQNNRLLQKTDPQGGTRLWTYDAQGNIASETDENGNTTLYSYDSENRISSLTDALNNTTSYSYDDLGNVTSESDALGNTTRYSYDSKNRVQSETDAAGGLWRYEYDAEDNRIRSADPNGNVTCTWYDANHRVIQSVDGMGYVTTWTYDGNGNVLSRTLWKTPLSGPIDPTQPPPTPVASASAAGIAAPQTVSGSATGDQTIRYTYDKNNRMIGMVDATGGVWSWAYDGAGNQVQAVDPNGNTTVSYYDSNNRMVLRIDGEGYATARSYDATGMLSSETRYMTPVTMPASPASRPTPGASPADQVTRYTWDAKHRMTSVTDATGATQRYTYDAAGNRNSVTDANGNVTRNWFDSNGRMLMQVDPLGYVKAWKYDSAGNVLRETRYMTAISTAGLTATSPMPAPVSSAADQVTNYSYDRNNRMVKKTDANGGIWTWTYDAAGNALLATDANGNGTRNWYDGNNRVVLRVGALGNATGWSYDAAGNVLAMTRYMNPVATGGAIQPVPISSAADQVTRYSYDASNRLLARTDANGNTERYGWDAAGNQVSITDANGNITRNWYDHDNRLVLRVDALGYATAWGRDAVGNVLSETRYMTALTGPFNATLVPQPAGSAGDQVIRYRYDGNNRLLARTDALGNATVYAYDAVGNRISSTDANGNKTLYWYDRDNRAILQVDASGAAIASSFDAVGNLLTQTRYLGLLSGPFSTDVVPAPAASAGDQTTRYAYDANNQVVTRTDAPGNVARIQYDAVGNRIADTDVNGNTSRSWYDTENRLLMTVDAMGYATAFTRDAIGNTLTRTLYMTPLASVGATLPVPATSAGDQVTRYSWDGNNRLLTEINGEGNVTRYAYDAVGNRVSFTDANGNRTLTWYDADNRAILQADATGAATGWTYDAVDNMVTQTRYLTLLGGALAPATLPSPATSAGDQTTRYAYDLNKRLITRTDAAGGVWRTRYDAVGNRIAETDANGNTRRSWYDAVNRAVLQVDAQGAATAMAYDALGNMLTRTRYMSTVSVSGDTAPVPVTSAGDQLTRNSWDANNRLVQQIDAEGNTWSWRYDAAGNQLRAIDPLGNATTSWYDRNNRRILQLDAEGYATRWTYDGAGNAVQRALYMTPCALGADTISLPSLTSSAADQVTRYRFDRANRMVGQTDALGGVTSWVLDAVGNRISSTDALGNVTLFAWDNANRLASRVNAMGTWLASSNSTEALAWRSANGYYAQYTGASGQAADYAAILASQTERYAYDAAGNRVSMTDANGNATRYSYDANNRLVRTQDPLGNSMRQSWDAAGNMVASTDANGNVTRYAYDRENRLVSTVAAMGTWLATSNSAEAQSWRVTRGYYQTWVEGSVPAADVAAILASQSQSISYDAVGNRISVTDANGNATTYTHDRNNRMATRTDALNHSTRYTYDGAGNQVVMTDARGNATTMRYDRNNRLLQSTDALGNSSSKVYDGAGNLVAATDGNGNTTTYAWDASNRLIARTDALGNQRATSNSAAAQAWRTANGYYTTWTGAADQLAAQATILAACTERYAYDAAGNRVRVTDANGNATNYSYDANLRLAKQTDALGNITRYGYDAVGNRTSMVDARGNTTTSSYDVNNRLLDVRDALGNHTRTAWDAAGNRVSVTDARGNVTTYGYDANNRLTVTTDALGELTRYAWDAVGNQTAVTDARGNTTQYRYDTANWLSSRIHALGYQVSYTYDANGNVLTQSTQLDLADATRVAVVRNTWDAANRLAASRSAEGYLTTYEYDGAGNRTALNLFDVRVAANADPAVVAASSATRRSTRFAYDANKRVIAETSPLSVVTGYQYDAVGNRIAKIEAQGSTHERRSSIGYDAVNRVVRTVDAAGIVTRMVRDANGNLTELDENWNDGTSSAQRVTSTTYDALNRASSITNALGTVTQLTYDANGNLTQRRSAVGLSEARTENFEYDALNRQVAQVNGAGERTEYSLDAMGNRTRMTIGAGTAAARSLRYRYDNDNRLVGEIDGNGVETRYVLDGAGNRLQTIQLAATYDVLGNRIDTWNGISISGQTRSTRFAYDLDNRLLQVTDPTGGVTSYTLDVLGNRTRIIDAANHETDNSFDAAGRLLTNLVMGSTADNGVLTSNVYDDFGNIVRSRRGFANNTDVRQTSYGYDALNRQTSITGYDLVATLSNSTVFSQAFSTVFGYDAWGNQTSISRGQYLLQSTDTGYDSSKAAKVHALTGSFAYDKLNRLVSSTDGLGNVLAYTYDALGNRLSQTTGSGTSDARQVRFGYDAAGRLVRRETDTGAVIKMTYDAAGNQVSESTLQSGSETGTVATGDAPVWMTETYVADGNGRIVRQTDALGVVTRRVLDPFGNELQTVTAAGTSDERVQYREYDANNELVATIDAMGNRTLYTVDAMGNRSSETDANGNTIYYWHDSLNRQVATLDANGFLVTLAYDSAGNVSSTRVWSKTYSAPADGSAPVPLDSDTASLTTNTYSGSGKLLTQVAADGGSQAFAYDSADELTSITDSGNASGATARVQSFGYDNAGRKTRFTRADGVVETYAYDTAGNRVRETITTYDNSGNAVLERRTDLRFDADNRQTRRAFDPSGLNLVEALAYDKAGNVISKTDANGNVTRSRYDLGNRLLSITDAATSALAQLRATSNDQVWKDWRTANNYYINYVQATVDANAGLTAQYQAILALTTQSYGYDRVGNRTSITDAAGRTTNFEYDLDNRVTRQIQPAATIYTIALGLQNNVRPTVSSVYDAVGNLVQTIDANGYKTTWWYDGNGQRIAELKAEISGGNVLRTFSYDANGLLLSASLYMTELADTAHNIASVPGTPTGEVRTITNSYDAGGRLTKITYPSITITSLGSTGTAAPSESTRNAQPEESFAYDAFGNRVKLLDRNGNASWKWYDSNDRVVASVDEAGYLTETSYDDQGNVVQEVRYATALSVAGLAVGTRPSAPAGASYTVSRTYDKANRLVTEQMPTVSTLNAGVTSSERPTTKFEYDKNGNLVRKRLAADTVSEVSEYYVYDAANRQVAIVDAGKVLHVIGYDAVGNRVSFKRFMTPLATAVSTSTTFAQLLAAVSANASGDQETVYTYDALDRQATSTEVMGSGSADDITIQTWYDAAGKQTRRIDPDGYVTQTAYDAFGQVTQTVSPDGNRSFIEYDAAGMQTRAWTGDLGTNSATAATNITATIGSALNIGWSTSGRGLSTYVVWDTSARATPSAYANTSARQGSGSASVALSLAGIAAGSTVYFRVVTVDAAGSQAWTAEKSVVIPVTMSALSVSQSSGNLVVTATFNGTVTSPQLKYGSTGSVLPSTVNFSNTSGNTWSATIVSPSNGGQGLSWQVAWNANSSSYTTTATPFDAAGAHDVSGATNKWTVSWPVPSLAQGNAQLVLLEGARVDSAFQVNNVLQFDPGSFINGASKTYQVFYGNASSTSHSASVSWQQAQTESFSVAGYVTHLDANNNVVFDSTIWNATWVNSSSNVSALASVALDAAEVAKVSAGGMHVSWRAAGSGSSFANDTTMTKSGNSYSANLNLAPMTSYDFKIWYTDSATGREVIVEWRTVTSPAQPASSPSSQISTAGRDVLPLASTRNLVIGTLQTWSGKSLIVLGRELDGTLTRSGANLSINPGLYAGPVNPASASFAATVNTTTSAGAGSLQASGLTTASYFTEFQYNAIGNKIATNETTGQWRRLGVDAMGNILKTSVYGTREDETAGRSAIVTYAAFDARGLEVARFGAAVKVDPGGDGTEDATAVRAVTRFTYDYDRRKTSQIDPGNSSSNAASFVYNALGQVTSQTDALGNTTTVEYDRRGNEVRRTDALNHVTKQTWNLAGRKTTDVDALNNSTSYTLDGFGRITAVTDARGNATAIQYDQHDRLIKVTDALANITEYSYDKRDNRTWTRDANGNFFGVAYDSMRRVTARYAFSGGAPTSFANAADAVTNSSNAAHAWLLTESAEYDVYGNKTSDTDAEGRQKIYTYGAFGRLTSLTDEGQRVTTYTYDRFGRMTAEARADDDTTSGAKSIARTYDDAGHLKTVTDNTTQVSTSYTYTVAGLRAHETVSAPGLTSNTSTVATVRNISYSWDAAGQMTLWSDAVTNTNLAYTWDAADNLSRVASSDNSVNHYYSYDAVNRLTSKTQGTGGGATTLEAYTYDAVGNRVTFNDGSNTTTYTWNAVNRMTQGVTSKNTTLLDTSDDTRAQWTYDNVGNITRYEEFDKSAVSIYLQTYTLAKNYRITSSATTNKRDASSISITSTVNTLDKSGRLTQEVTTDSSDSNNIKTYTYSHTYSKDGRELSVTATGTGSLTGSSTSTYDANDKLIRLDLGKPDGSNNTAAYKQFRYGNDGQILTSFYDNGVSGDQDVNGEYLYANGHIVGQKANTTSSATVTTVLDDKDYSLNDIIGATFPGATVSGYEVQAGDTLQSIAAKQFGNPSLWYVLADANGLTGNESLKPGTRLTIPNTTAMGRLDADAHVVYNESQIIGSKLPNLAAPPPPEPDKCAQAAAIILTILVSILAVVVTVLTAGALAPLAIAAAGVTATSAAGIIIGATVGAVVGATIGLASGAINQGIKIGLKVQTEFNWKEVAADVAAGAIGGVGAAFSGAAQASIKAAVAAEQLGTNAARMARVAAVVMDAAFNVAGEAASQAITYNGRIEEPWMLGVAGGASILGEALKPLGSRAWRAIKPTAFGRALQTAGKSVKNGFGKVFRVSGSGGRVAAASADQLTEAGDNALASTLRSADSNLVIHADGKADLSLRASTDAFDANGRTSAFTPTNTNDNAAHTLAPVQAQSSIDQLADPKTVQVTRKALAGEVNGLTNKSQTELAQGTVGRVRYNTIPVSQLSNDAPELNRIRSASTLNDQWETGLASRQNNIDVATPGNAASNRPSIANAPDTPRNNLPDNAVTNDVADALQAPPRPPRRSAPPVPDNASTPLANDVDATPSLRNDSVELNQPDATSPPDFAPTYVNLSLDDVQVPDLRPSTLSDSLDDIPNATPSSPRTSVGEAQTGQAQLDNLPDRNNAPTLANDALDDVPTNGLRTRGNSMPELDTPSTNRVDTQDNQLTPDNAAPAQAPLQPTPSNQVATPVRGRNRAVGYTENNLPEPALDLRGQVEFSSQRFLLSPNIVSNPKAADQALTDYFDNAVQVKLQKSTVARSKQLFDENEYLRKIKPDFITPKSVVDERLYRFQEMVATSEISGSKSARKAMAEYFTLRERDFATSPAARTKQFLEMDEALSRVLGGTQLSKPTQQVIRNEMRLLRDAANDANLLRSAFVRNPTHVMELKRLGMQASAASRIGQFTDVRLDGAMKELGSGNLNTVYLGKYILPDNKGSFDGVFKMEARELRNGVDVVPMAGKFSGIDMSNPRFGYRNVATTRLDEMLGFDITTRTEMAIYRGKLGTVAERASGVSPKGSQMRMLPNKLSDAEVAIKHDVAKRVHGYKPGEDWTRLINDDSDETINRVIRNGQEEYYLSKRTANELNYSDPVLRRGLVRLQLEDAIAGQVDRHYGNYFVLQDKNGKVISVKGIDNDLSWGKDLRQVEKIGAVGVHLPEYLPRVVDKQAFDSIMALNREKLMQRLGGVLQRDEIDAAVARLDAVKAHLKKVEAKGRVLNSVDDWRGDAVRDLLTRRRGIPPGSPDFQSNHTSYVSRDMALTEHKRQAGLLDPYPANRYAT